MLNSGNEMAIKPSYDDVNNLVTQILLRTNSLTEDYNR